MFSAIKVRMKPQRSKNRAPMSKKVQWKHSIKQLKTPSPLLTQDVFAREMELYWLKPRASLTSRIVAGEKEWTSSLIFHWYFQETSAENHAFENTRWLAAALFLYRESLT